MRTETFHEEHDVALTDEDRNIRGRQAARGALALKKHDELVKTRAEEWRTLKKQLAGEREQKLETLRAVSVAAETGIEPRQVLCDEVLVGAMVITRRLDMDPPADVSSRPASQDELKGIDRDNHPKAPPKLHAVPASTAAPPAIDLGVELRAKLIELVATKPRSSTLTLKALAVRVSEVQPDSKPKQREKAADEAVKLALADGAIVRNDTGLLCLPVAAAPEPADDEIPFGYDATDEHAGDDSRDADNGFVGRGGAFDQQHHASA